MVKLEKYLGNKVYMCVDGSIATREAILAQFPAALTFTHIIETDEGGEVCFAVQNLSAMRSFHNIDSSLSESEAIVALETIRNTPPPEPGVSAEERIASALEFQNAVTLANLGLMPELTVVAKNWERSLWSAEQVALVVGEEAVTMGIIDSTAYNKVSSAKSQLSK